MMFLNYYMKKDLNVPSNPSYQSLRSSSSFKLFVENQSWQCQQNTLKIKLYNKALHKKWNLNKIYLSTCVIKTLRCETLRKLVYEKYFCSLKVPFLLQFLKQFRLSSNRCRFVSLIFHSISTQLSTYAQLDSFLSIHMHGSSTRTRDGNGSGTGSGIFSPSVVGMSLHSKKILVSKA